MLAYLRSALMAILSNQMEVGPISLLLNNGLSRKSASFSLKELILRIYTNNSNLFWTPHLAPTPSPHPPTSTSKYCTFHTLGSGSCILVLIIEFSSIYKQFRGPPQSILSDGFWLKRETQIYAIPIGHHRYASAKLDNCSFLIKRVI